ESVPSHHGLLTTVAWWLGGETTYALEGSVFVAGAAVQWLRDGLGLIGTAAETEALATSVPDTGGVFVVPAFAGLGAPYWDPAARGTIVGVTRGTERAHLVRATLESIAHQTCDVVEAMAADQSSRRVWGTPADDVPRAETGAPLLALRVDGGAAANNFLMQRQADLLGIPVERAAVAESTALGAAALAGLAVGFWSSPAALAARRHADRTFQPRLGQDERPALPPPRRR